MAVAISGVRLMPESPLSMRAGIGPFRRMELLSPVVKFREVHGRMKRLGLVKFAKMGTVVRSPLNFVVSIPPNMISPFEDSAVC